jgi:hypothetical protein
MVMVKVLKPFKCELVGRGEGRPTLARVGEVVPIAEPSLAAHVVDAGLGVEYVESDDDGATVLEGDELFDALVTQVYPFLDDDDALYTNNGYPRADALDAVMRQLGVSGRVTAEVRKASWDAYTKQQEGGE